MIAHSQDHKLHTQKQEDFSHNGSGIYLNNKLVVSSATTLKTQHRQESLAEK